LAAIFSVVFIFILPARFSSKVRNNLASMLDNMKNYEQQAQPGGNPMNPAEYMHATYPTHIGTYCQKPSNDDNTPNRQQKNIYNVFSFCRFVQFSSKTIFRYSLQPFPMYANVNSEKQGTGNPNGKMKGRITIPPHKRKRQKNSHAYINGYLGSFATHQPTLHTYNPKAPRFKLLL